MDLINHKKVIRSISLTPDNEYLDELFLHYMNDFKVIPVAETRGLHSIGYILLLFSKTESLPPEVNHYPYLMVKINGIWKRKSLLGTCDKCCNYDELILSSSNGQFCPKCMSIEL